MPHHPPSRVLIIGTGIAGLSLALRLADSGVPVTLLAKNTLSEGSSLYAQGGIAAVVSAQDSFSAHIQDTMEAGAGLCRPEAVELAIHRSPQVIHWLVDQGIRFSGGEGDTPYHLTREGGHSVRRVVHVQDATGYTVEKALEDRARSHKNIRVHENHIAIDLITSARLGLPSPERCLGVYALDIDQAKVFTLDADVIVLATGGASKAYLYTSNPDTSTGDGIAMAWRAGCRIANMEFVQFHPTCLYHPHAKSLLMSEAVRGEGGKLLLPNGSRFMDSHDHRAELAPRDIVARAIDYEMKRRGVDCVYLDISHKPADFITEHFPNLHKLCLKFGYDMTRDPIPVVPAAHYTCGGVVTDLNARTDLMGLYAIGECAYTGLHGANRLASNSLLECLVFAESACKDISANLNTHEQVRTTLPPWDESRVTDPDEQIVVAHNWDELRRFMWDYVGIVRSTKRLLRAQHRIVLLQEEIRDFYSNFRVGNDLIELRNLAMVAELTILCALDRKESRGLHYTLDFPNKAATDRPTDTVLVPPNFVGRELEPSWYHESATEPKSLTRALS
ncbi:MAG: L-aspartate oxidase [Gammaproteobacteria bacterium]|nr:L-aspartate oxidase [Gammaproteobacteria bacterium]